MRSGSQVVSKSLTACSPSRYISWPPSCSMSTSPCRSRPPRTFSDHLGISQYIVKIIAGEFVGCWLNTCFTSCRWLEWRLQTVQKTAVTSYSSAVGWASLMADWATLTKRTVSTSCPPRLIIEEDNVAVNRLNKLSLAWQNPQCRKLNFRTEVVWCILDPIP